MQIPSMNSITQINGLPPLSGSKPSAPQESGSFGSLIKDFVQQTNQDQLNSDSAVQDLLTGKTDNVQDVVLATAKAEMSFQLFMEIRNQLVSAYNDLMRMQF